MNIPAVLVIYTGGTIGMKAHPATGELVPFRFEHCIVHYLYQQDEPAGAFNCRFP